MLNHQKLVAGGIAGLALLLSAGAALAYPATAAASVNVRAGPGTGYRIVDSLYPGETVDVGPCQGSWCRITHSGPDGWVAAGYLEGAHYATPVYVEPEYVPEYIPVPTYIGPSYNHRGNFPHRPFNHQPGNFHPPGNYHPPGTGFPGSGSYTPHPHMGQHQSYCQMNPTAPQCMPHNQVQHMQQNQVTPTGNTPGQHRRHP